MSLLTFAILTLRKVVDSDTMIVSLEEAGEFVVVNMKKKHRDMRNRDLREKKKVAAKRKYDFRYRNSYTM